MWIWRRTGVLFRAGGLDDQPATRLHTMLFADKVKNLFERREIALANKKNFAELATEDDRQLLTLLYEEAG